VDLGIAGRVALVTASSKGLGRASAEALAAEGVKVVLCARGREALEATAEGIRSAGGEVLAVPADVTEPDQPARLVAAAVEAYGKLDIVVANAGGPPPASALDVDDAGLDSALNANLRTSIRLAQAAVPHMRAAGWGRLCFVASVSVRQPIGNLALSNVARTGLWAWAKTAAQDLRDTGITVNLACPGSHATDRMKALSHAADVRMGDPADFGKVVAFLCSEPASFVSGIAMGVDGAAVAGLL
jgi:3-oxoacyl-[acyl-carrier protein] reductase